MRDGERDGRHAVFRVAVITENRLNHHFFLWSVDFVHSGPQAGIFTLPTDEAMLWIGTSFATLKKCATMNLRRVAGKVWGKDWGIPMPQWAFPVDLQHFISSIIKIGRSLIAKTPAIAMLYYIVCSCETRSNASSRCRIRSFKRSLSKSQRCRRWSPEQISRKSEIGNSLEQIAKTFSGGILFPCCTS